MAGAVPVRGDVPLVVVEGNYLLHDDGAWAGVAPLLDDIWYLDLDDAVRVERLVARHVAHGRTPRRPGSGCCGRTRPTPGWWRVAGTGRRLVVPWS